MTLQNIKGVLFDFDGVLADTMEDNYQAWKKAFEDYDVKIDRNDYFPMEGIKLIIVAETISEKYGLKNINYSDIVAKKEDYFKKNNTFSLYPGVSEIIYALKKKNVKIAVVTAAQKSRLFSSAPSEFLRNFDAIITGDMLQRGKPYPDPYVKAMEELNVKSDECIIIENSPAGILSAKNAKAYCIAIASTMDKSFLKNADEVVGKFLDLKNNDRIKRLLN